MAKHSTFRDFITALRRRWRIELPYVQPAATSYGPMMAKASTFYAGVARPLGMHVFINFQHSCKAWQVGQFTVNIILSRHEGAPEGSGGPFAPDDGVSFTEGRYRICDLLGRKKDKWWHLKVDEPSIIREEWRPTSYDDYAIVLSEAVSDVTRDVREALEKLGVNVAAQPGPK